MKKIVLIFVLGVFAFAGSGFKNQAKPAEVVSTDCFELADQSARLIGRAFGMSYYEESLIFHTIFDSCLDQN